jgi:hypothetical protein
VYEVVHLEHECTNHLSIWTDGFAYLKDEMMRSGEEGANWLEDGDGVRVAESADSRNDKTLFWKNTACLRSCTPPHRSVVGVGCIEPIRKA